MLESHAIPTASVGSFVELVRRLKASGFGLDPGAADQIVLAVAGPVRDGRVHKLTNAPWGIDPRDAENLLPPGRTVLVNDFVAQALGCGTQAVRASAVTVQAGEVRPGIVAAVGAGTGLGQCALSPLPDGGVLPLPSEGGHAPLAFVTAAEFEFLRFLQVKTGHSHAFGDIVVSGRGLSALHQFLTGQNLLPAEVAREIGPDSETTAWFARFFARVCRAYALHILAWGGLYLCGGLAARNPFLVTHPEFLREFRDCPAYGQLLAAMPVRLITAADTGLHGAARHAGMLPDTPGIGASHVFVA